MIQETNKEKWDPFDSIMAENSINQSLIQPTPSVDERLKPLIQKQVKEFRTLKHLEETLKTQTPRISVWDNGKPDQRLEDAQFKTLK